MILFPALCASLGGAHVQSVCSNWRCFWLVSSSGSLWYPVPLPPYQLALAMCRKHAPPDSKHLLAWPEMTVTIANLGSFTGSVKFTTPFGFQCPLGCGWKDNHVSEIFFAPQEGTFLPEVGTTYDWEKQRYV